MQRVQLNCPSKSHSSQFTRACRRVKEIFPPLVERNLTRLLFTKLRERAVYAVEDKTCETVNQLIDLLNEAFGSFKTLDQYRGELSTVFLRPHEHVLITSAVPRI